MIFYFDRSSGRFREVIYNQRMTRIYPYIFADKTKRILDLNLKLVILLVLNYNTCLSGRVLAPFSFAEVAGVS